jgi:hypothetical protein
MFRLSWVCGCLLFVGLSSGVAQAATVTLAWDRSTDPSVTGYTLYWGNLPGSHPNSLNVGNVTQKDLSGLTDGMPYYFVVRAYNSSGMLSAESMEVSRRVGVPMSVGGDLDGDFKSDITVFRPSTGQWITAKSSSSYATWSATQWGMSGDVPVAGDYDGDGKVDPAVFRPSTGYWFLLKSSTNYANWIINNWGTTGDVPVPGDYDGDGKTDMAVYRPSMGYWFLLKSSTNYATWI